jgi:hypothetical protein
MLQNLTPEVTQPHPNKIDEADATREFITRKLTRKLLRLVGTVQTEPRDASMEEKNCTLSSTVLPSSHINMTNLVLEFVRFVCTVLGLACDYHWFAEAQPLPPIWLACGNLPMKLYFAIHVSCSIWVMFLADTALHFMTLTSTEIQSSCHMILMVPEHIGFVGDVETNTTALRLRWSQSDLLDCLKECSCNKICTVASASRFAQTMCLDIAIVPDHTSWCSANPN